MSKDACLKLASPFGSGIAYMQETCGAVSGALMAIGLKYGRGKVEKTVDYLDKNNVIYGKFLRTFDVYLRNFP